MDVRGVTGFTDTRGYDVFPGYANQVVRVKTVIDCVSRQCWGLLSSNGTVVATSRVFAVAANVDPRAYDQVLYWNDFRTAPYYDGCSADNLKVTLVDAVCAPPPSGLVGWWPGDGHPLDLEGTNHGTLVNGAAYGWGVAQRGFKFDGANSAFLIPASPATDVGTQAGFTIQAWLRPAGNRLVMWVGWSDDESNYGPLGYLMSDNSAHFNLVDTSGAHHVITSPPGTIIPSEVQHLALTYDKASGAARIWRNAQVVASANLGSLTASGWQTVPGTATRINGRWTQTVNRNGDAQFFRLKSDK